MTTQAATEHRGGGLASRCCGIAASRRAVDCPNLDDVPGSRGWGVSGSDCRAESDGPEAADEGGGGMGGEGREGREVEAIEDGPVDDWLQSGPGSLH
jgi:hypothetical protein